MKKFILNSVLLFFIVVTSYGQNNFNYQEFSNPDSKNELSLYFKKEVPKKLLKKAKFLPKKNNVVLSFSINKENKPYHISIALFGSKELSKSITEAFEKHPLENLNLDSLDKRNRYYLQIISKKDTKNIFNCSTKIIVETPSICEPCKDLEYFEDLKTCLNLEVKKYFYNNTNFDLLSSLDNPEKSKLKDEKDIELYLYQETELFINFLISENGQLINKKTKVPTVFKGEVSKLFETFSTNIKSGTFNGKENKPTHSFTIKYKKGEKPVYKDSYLIDTEYTKPSLKSPLSIFYAEKLSKEFIEKVNLNRINKTLKIYFELDKKNKPFNITTNARSSFVEDKIISIFKEFPLEKLKFAKKSKFNRYEVQILSFNEGNIVVNASSVVSYLSIPVFPGCEDSKDTKELKKCFSKGVQQHFAQKFDANLPNRLGLASGRLRISIFFKIDKQGKVTQLRTKISKPSPEIKAEVLRVMNSIPTMIHTAKHNSKAVNIKYSIPFTLIVE